LNPTIFTHSDKAGGSPIEYFMNFGEAHVMRSDARTLPLANESVDLVVTSPPYFALRSYHDGGEHYQGQIGNEATPKEFVDALIEATEEMVRVLKPGGSIWVNLGDKYSRGSRPRNQPDQFRKTEEITYNDPKYLKDTSPENSGITGKSLMGIPWRYAIRCIDDLKLILRAEVIWHKSTGLPESVTDRVVRKHETWFHFTKNQKYFSNIDAIREPHVTDVDHDKGKVPESIWRVGTEPLKLPADLPVRHYAAFPIEFPRRIILGWSPAQGVVLDPFGGSGTTAAVAKALGRTGLSTDLSTDYGKLAQWRCNEEGFTVITDKLGLTTPVKKKPRQKRNSPIDGQATLL
jgi:DNA modification methylase